jgi:hypothetical protein
MSVVNTLDVVSKFYTAISLTGRVADTNIGSKGIFASAYRASYDIGVSKVKPLYKILEITKKEVATNKFESLVIKHVESISRKNNKGFADITSIISSIKKVINKDLKRRKGNRLVKYSLTAGQIEAMKTANALDTTVLIADALIELRKIISEFVRSVSYLLDASEDGNVPFLFNTSVNNNRNLPRSFNESKLFKRDVSSFASTVIINTGSLIRKYFYSCADNVVLSTGTWVYPDSMYKALGINIDNSYFHEVPTSFNKNRRPIFMIRDS